MSISHLEYRCTACDYHSTSLSLHGRRYYAFNDRLLRASYKIGWCFGCHALAPIESLIETTKHEQKKERLAKMKIELEQKIANKPKVERTWFQKLVGVKEQISEGSVFESYEFKALSTEIEDEIILLKLFEARRAPTKCLECGGEKHMYLSKIEARDELYNRKRSVNRIF